MSNLTQPQPTMMHVQPVKQTKPSARPSLAERIVELAADSGGKLTVTQRALAETLGTNAPAINRALARLRAAGGVRLKTTGRATTITLVTNNG